MVTYPSDWPVVQLGTKCEVTSSKRVFESEWTTAGIPFFRTRDVVSLLSGEPQKDRLFISEKTYANKIASSGEPQKGDLLVTGVGSIGLPYLIQTDQKMYFKDGNILWFKRSDSFYPKFLYLLFLSKNVQQQISDMSGFTTVGTFTIKNAKLLTVPLPPLPEQEAIAEAITAFDTHIENLSALIDKKRAVRDGALEDLVNGKMILNGLCGRWMEKPLCQFASYRTERATTERRFYVSTENMRQNFLGIVPYHDMTVAYGMAFDVGDILLGNIRPYLKKIWFADFSGSCSADVLVIRALENCIPQFLYYLLANDKFIGYIMAGGVKGIKMPRGDKEYIMKYSVLLPDNTDDQKAIASGLYAMDEEITALEAERDKYAQLREGVMDDLLTGRVRLNV